MEQVGNAALKYGGVIKEQIENQGLDLLLHGRLTTLTMSKLLANTLGAIPLGAFLPKQLCKITLLQHGLKESKFLNMSSLMTESLKRISLHSIRDVVNPLPVKSLRLTALKTLKWSHLTAAAEKKLSPKRRLAAKRDKNGKLIPTKCCFQTGFGYKCFIKCNAPHKDVTVQQCEANKKCQSDCKSCLPLSDTTTTAPKSTTTAPPSTTTTAPTSTTTAPRVTTTAPKPRKTLTDAMLSKLVLGDFNLDLLGFTAADIDLAFLARLAFSKLSNDVLAKIKLCDILNAVLNSVQVKDIAQSLQEYLSGLTLDSVKPDFLKNIKISSLVDNARSTLKLQDFLPWKLEQLGLGDQGSQNAYVKKVLAEATALVLKVKLIRENAGISTVRKFVDYAADFVSRMDSVISTAKTVNNAVKTWTDAEAGLKEVLTIVREVMEETGLQNLLGNIGKSQKGLLNFGKNIVDIASKVVDKVASYVPLADEYTTMAEDVIKFIDNFDAIEDVIKNVGNSVRLTKGTAVVKRKPGGCYRKDALLPDLCVSLTTITPEVSLYKKLWFPLEMIFLNMLSTKGMIPDISAVSKSMRKCKLDQPSNAQEINFLNIHPCQSWCYWSRHKKATLFSTNAKTVPCF